MAAHEPLHPDLVGRAFRVAEAARLGVPQKRLRRRDLLAPHRGIRVDRPPETIRERCADYLPLLRPGLVFSHGTAALLHGMPMPRAVAEEARLHVSAPPPLRPPRARGVIGHELSHRDGFGGSLHGLPVMTATETWCELGGLSLEELVVAGDHLIRHGVDGRDAVRRELSDCVCEVRRPGAQRLDEAILLLRPGVRSPQESMLRVVVVLAGLPEPEVNARVHGDDGGFLGEGDLVYREARLVLEYEGRHHLTDAMQWSIDIRRRERFEDAGWSVLRVTAPDLFQGRSELVARIARRLGVVPTPRFSLPPSWRGSRPIEERQGRAGSVPKGSDLPTPQKIQL